MGSTQELQHWGIKGQHWGIRRYQNPDGSLTEAGKKRYYYQNPDGSLTEAGKKDYMKAARKGKLDSSKLSDDDLNMINARFAREKTFNQNVSDYEKSTFKYRLKEAAIARIKGSGGGKKKGGGVVAKLLAEPVKKAFEEAFKSDNGGKGKGNNKKDDSDSQEDRKDKETKPNNAPKNASNSNASLSRLAGWSMSKSLDTLEHEGYVSTGKKAAPKLFSRMDEIEKNGYSGVHKTWSNMSSSRLDDIEREGWTRHSGIYVVTRSSDDDHLAHFGIKGQKWGVRRFENDDGTLTEEGRERYGVSKKELKREGREMNSLMKNAKKAFGDYSREYQLSKSKRIQNLADDDLKEKFKKQVNLHNKVVETADKSYMLDRELGIDGDKLDSWDPKTVKKNYGINQKQYDQAMKARNEYHKSNDEYEKASKEFSTAERAKTQAFIKDYMNKPYSKIKYSKKNEEIYANYVERVLNRYLGDSL